MLNFIQYLTYFRIISAPLIFFLIVISHSYGWALILFILASSTDYWDGYLARKYNLESIFGEVLDPIADKILILFLLFALSIHFDSTYISFVGSIILSREFWVAALRDFNSRAGNSEATKVSFFAKIKTSIQLISIGLYLVALSLNSSLLMLIADLNLFLALIVTLQTGLQYTIATFRFNDD